MFFFVSLFVSNSYRDAFYFIPEVSPMVTACSSPAVDGVFAKTIDVDGIR
ncbi:MAG: hypothetical protein PHI78_04595 [Clostridia bacterium]|nr:hypothetical protein [Clostridia bacterium]